MSCLFLLNNKNDGQYFKVVMEHTDELLPIIAVLNKKKEIPTSQSQSNLIIHLPCLLYKNILHL